MINWLNKNKKFISITAIGEHTGMPNSTLTKAMSGVQKLPKKWIEPLDKFIREFRQS